MPMAARSAHESHRVATPLELFFDLVFVVAIARAAAGLHHAIAEEHLAHGLVGYAMVFFAIWWAWMNFTWFASAYDCDDVPYRLATFVQITGALILAAGIPAMFDALRPNGAVVGGYVVMRMAAVAQWLRAASGDPPRRTTALRYAAGISIAQAAWAAMLMTPPSLGFVVFFVLVGVELVIPIWAESAAQTTWHPHHIAERYGLLTIIVLGESVLACTVAIGETLEGGSTVRSLLPTIAGSLLILYSMWWIYFDRPVHGLLTSLTRAIGWGYGHYLVFAAAAAVGAGVAASVDAASGEAAVTASAARFAVTIPVATYLLVLWQLHDRPRRDRSRWIAPVAAPLLFVASWSGQPILVTGLILAGVVGIRTALDSRGAH
jgi:low temperature requirement protein LtrA